MDSLLLGCHRPAGSESGHVGGRACADTLCNPDTCEVVSGEVSHNCNVAILLLLAVVAACPLAPLFSQTALLRD